MIISYIIFVHVFNILEDGWLSSVYSYKKGVIHKSLALIYILASYLFDDKNVFLV